MPRTFPRALAAILSVSIVACSRGGSSPADRPSPAPPPAPPPAGATRLVAVGDFGMGNGDEREVAGAIRSIGPLDAFVTTGDNVYSDGSPEHFQEAWIDPYGWVQDAGIPVIASLGNHDRETDGGAPVAGLLGMPADWYVRRVGPVDLIVLDVGRIGETTQITFLRDALASSTAPWQVVVFHEPVYSCSKHGSTPEVQAAWLAAIEGGGADLVLNGHDHAYQRFDPDGTTYVVTGGGGGPLYDVGNCRDGTPQPATAESVLNYVVIDATPSALAVRAIAVPSGDTIDRFALRR